jgi:hypothetical protein
MKIIDFHTHIFPDALAARAIDTLIQHSPDSRAYTNGTMTGLRQSMKQSGIAKSVLLPIATKPAQVVTINRGCKDLMAADIIPFGTLHPDFADFAGEIAYLKSIRVRGIKFHPEYQDFYIDDTRYFGMYEAVSDAGLVAVFHAGKDPGPFTCDHALPVAFAAVRRNFPRLKMVASHMGGWKLWPDVEKHLLGLALYFDSSAVKDWMPAPEFIRLARAHGTDRILFGTDSPWFDQAATAAWIDSMPLTQEEKERIFFKNAEELLGG